MTEDMFASRLREALCATWAVREDASGHWTVRSPLLFDDGDALPVFIVQSDGEWSLTDRGMTVSHLFFDEFQFTEARFSRVAQLADSHGAELSEQHELSLRLSAPPTAHDVGTFLQLVAQVQGVALTSRTERDQTRYITTVRKEVEERLVSADFEENWSPPELRSRMKANYRADLRIGEPSGKNVLLFAASTSDKANVSALTISRFKSLSLPLVPILVYRPDRVASEAIYRFQDEVGEADAAIAVEPGNYAGLFAALRATGVELQAP